MKSKIIIAYCMGLLLLSAIVPVSSYAGVPQLINYQGKLMEDGAPVTGSRWMGFSIWDNPTGGVAVDGLWHEQQEVMVTDGCYSVELGSEQVLPSNLLNFDDLFLQVDIQHPTHGWQRLLPLMPFDSTLFAIKAGRADSVKDGCVTSAMISPGAVNTEKMANDAITSEKILDGSVTAYDIHDGSGSGLDADRLDGHDTSHFATAAYVASLEDRIDFLETNLNYLISVFKQGEGWNVDKDGDDVVFKNVNIKIVNGSGKTETSNGVGNLIVGYNEPRTSGSDKSGSHNIVVGPKHNYSSYGGLVAGYSNEISGSYACVSGGESNIAEGTYSSVSGGSLNTAENHWSSIAGGYGNTASHLWSSVSGGYGNTASGRYSIVSGGESNTASDRSASVSGGHNNLASGYYSSVSGGHGGTSSGDSSSISGGRYNQAKGTYSFVGGGGGWLSQYGNQANGDYAAVLGGIYNKAGNDPNDGNNGVYSAILGGDGNITTGNSSTVGGGCVNTASATRSSVAGGHNVNADGDYDTAVQYLVIQGQ